MSTTSVASKPRTVAELFPPRRLGWRDVCNIDVSAGLAPILVASTAVVLTTLFWFTVGPESRVRFWARTTSTLACAVGQLCFSKGSGSLFSSAPPFAWKKQVVLITGGGSGLGACLALKLVGDPTKAGVRVVVLTDREPVYADDIANLHTYICDVSDQAAVRSAAEKIKAEVGEPTVIINNAGTVKGKLLLDLTEEDVKQTFHVNTLAHFWILKAFLPALIWKKAGHVVTVSSVLGVVGAAQMTDYCASKAALVGMHQSLRAELDYRYKTPDVHTTLVLPAHMATPLFADIAFPRTALFRFLAPTLTPPAVADKILRRIEAQTSGTLRMPLYTQAARVLGNAAGLAPAWLGALADHVSGAHWTMYRYGPRPDAAEHIEMERQLRSSAADWKG
ncbi:hypothetical protein Q5752_005736 [Cryptotrichosporon argae]